MVQKRKKIESAVRDYNSLLLCPELTPSLNPDVVDCQAQERTEGHTTVMRVADFFAEYMLGAQRTGSAVKKLKDWPADTEFGKKFPDLYDDFHQAMPAPDYTRRDGVLNISAHVSGSENCMNIDIVTDAENRRVVSKKWRCARYRAQDVQCLCE